VSAGTDATKVAGCGRVATEPFLSRARKVTAVSDRPDDWRDALEAEGSLTAPITQALIAAHGDRGAQAIEAVSEGRVKQYRDFVVVVGHEEEYVVEDGGCDCKDATYNLDPDDPEQLCWHALAVEIAERVGAVDHHDMWYSDVREFL
jgi:predicted nucleic acid-binding Zn finger protein